MKRVGLTGGIGSGKSTAVAYLRAAGVTVIDHDELAHEVVAPGSAGLERIHKVFGSDVIAADGSLDRKALAAIVFDDPTKRKQLEAIIHPLIHKAAVVRDNAARHAGEKLVVHDIPLLVETAFVEDFDDIIVINVPVEQRVKRVATSRGMNVDEVRRRVTAQIDDEARLAAATIVWDNSGNPADLERSIATWLKQA